MRQANGLNEFTVKKYKPYNITQLIVTACPAKKKKSQRRKNRNWHLTFLLADRFSFIIHLLFYYYYYLFKTNILYWLLSPNLLYLPPIQILKRESFNRWMIVPDNLLTYTWTFGRVSLIRLGRIGDCGPIVKDWTCSIEDSFLIFKKKRGKIVSISIKLRLVYKMTAMDERTDG